MHVSLPQKLILSLTSMGVKNIHDVALHKVDAFFVLFVEDSSAFIWNNVLQPDYVYVGPVLRILQLRQKPTFQVYLIVRFDASHVP